MGCGEGAEIERGGGQGGDEAEPGGDFGGGGAGAGRVFTCELPSHRASRAVCTWCIILFAHVVFHELAHGGIWDRGAEL